MERNWVQLREIWKETRLDYLSADSMAVQTVHLLDLSTETTNLMDYNLDSLWAMY